MNEPLSRSAWLSKMTIEELLDVEPARAGGWRLECEIIEGYLPPHPRPETRPRLVIRYQEVFLRYSAGPLQGFFWDIYGEDFQTVTLAVRAIMLAPRPVIQKVKL